MNQYIAEILKCRIENMSFADKVAGLVMPVTANIDGGVKIFPVAANSKHNDCIAGQYNDLMPNSRYKSVMYFEDLGIEFGTRTGDIQEFRSRLKLVAWLNLSKIMDENCPDSGAICAVLEAVNALSQKMQNYAPVLSLAVDINQVTRDKNIFSEYTYDEKYSQYLFYPYDFFAITITVRAKINYACLCDTNLPTGCYPAVPSIVKQICIDAESFDGTMIDGDCIRLRDFADGKYYANVNGQWVEVTGGGTENHNELNNLDYANSGHTGFEVEGAAAQALADAKSYTDTEIGLIPAPDLSSRLKLDQTVKETLSASPIFGNLTAWRVVLVGADKSLTDVTDLFWDFANRRLGINKNTPLSALHLKATSATYGGGFRLEQSASTLLYWDIIPASGQLFFLKDGHIPTWVMLSNGLQFGNDLATSPFLLRTNGLSWLGMGGNTGFGTRTATEKVEVVGNIKASGSVQVGDNTALASATNVGSFRYRETANNSYSEQCVRNGAASYIWKALNTETW